MATVLCKKKRAKGGLKDYQGSDSSHGKTVYSLLRLGKIMKYAMNLEHK